MTPTIPSSVSNISHIPGTAFITRKKNSVTGCRLLGNSTKQTLSPQKYILPLSTSVRLFPQFRFGCALHHKSRMHMVLATGTDVAVEEPDSVVSDKDTGEDSGMQSNAEGTSDESSVRSDASAPPVQSKRSRTTRKSEMPPVKNEDLVPGAIFTGKVRSIQPFGAFVDFGAFTDGLVHVSRLSDSFVKDVGSIVSIGQEVKVRLVEANTETGRISLTMRESDDASSDKARPSRRSSPKSNQKRDEGKKSSKFVKGQDLEGKVKNLTRAGAFISLPDGEEGFLPKSEESDDGYGNMMGGTSLQVDQEISVRVLRISRGQVTLTMKKEDVGQLDSKVTQGVVHGATNPFLLAFRKNKDIAAFLDEREKEEEPANLTPRTSEKMEGKVDQFDTGLDNLKVQDQPASRDGESVSAPFAMDEIVEDDGTSSKELDVGARTVDDALTETTKQDEDPETIVSNSSQSEDDAIQTIEEAEVSSESLAPEGSISPADQINEEALEDDEKSSLPRQVTDQFLSSESLDSKEVTERLADDAVAEEDKVQVQTPTEEITPVEDEKAGANPLKNGSITSSNGQIDTPTPESTREESRLSEEVAESQVDNSVVKDDVQIQAPDVESKIPCATTVEDEKVEPVPEKNGSVTISNAQAGASSPKESTTKAAISPALVKQLREETGAGMMDCKKALSEAGGDIVKAQEFLRKKGLASADKKASRATAEGRIGSYIHDSRIGVLLEVNCETDFVSRGDIFKELVDDLAMQVAACPQVQYLVTEDVPHEIVDKEREIEMQKEDLLSKPEQIRSKIVEGRIRKRLEEVALLEQPYIKNDKMVVKDWVKQTIATIGENIKVKRFVRYNLGEGLEKKSQDFAAEVAAQTAAKAVSATGNQPAAVEAKETVEKPKATVSAALVKQLREETGAGMMDCKKALSETGGDLEKAQEYLRKKGLSAADKKSSRLAAEGRIGSYIHDSRIGVLIEVNCETDFVGRSEKFKELVDDLAMQVVASPQVQYVSIEDIPETIVSKEKELEMQREDLLSKPENIRERIVEGRISKRLGELALLEQPFIKNDSILVKELVTQTVAALGENIKVRRFIRFTLGETIESAKTESEA
ncbi:polyprotein of EF-Ts, chloroplastic [Cornus florida]|uniref:polyprotein of EF-Ts, chloroplastic n=1 Tax=Cornus florida TaxID=4283 RepID=UPI002898E6CF|nr:polyprotein of EF-Ts, chloroplastic [Cornus florida]